jgi:hypothetical protein
MRLGRDDAHAQRHPVDAHVQKTADDAAKREKNQRPKMERQEGQIVRAENRIIAHKYGSSTYSVELANE